MKILFRFVLPVVGLALLGGVVFSPWLVGWVVQSELRSQLMAMGADEVRVEEVAVNLVNGRVDVRHLQVLDAGQTVLRVNAASVDWLWGDLMAGTLRYAAVNGGFAVLEMRNNGSVGLRGLTPVESNDETVSPPPEFLLSRLDLTQFRLLVEGVQRPQTVTVDRLRLTNFGTNYGTTKGTDAAPILAKIDAELAVAQGHLTVKGDLQPFAEVFGAQLLVTVAGADVADITGLSPEALDMTVNGRFHGKLQLGVDEKGVSVDGSLKIRRAQLQLAEQSIFSNGVMWKGQVVRANSGALSVDGFLQMGPVDFEDHSQALKATLKGGTWQGKARVSADGESVSIKGETGLTYLEVYNKNKSSHSFKISVFSVRWNAHTELSMGKALSVNSNGEIIVRRLKGRQRDIKKRISNNELVWKGRVKGKVKDAASHWTLAGVLNGEDLALSETSKNAQLDTLHWQGKAEVEVSQALVLQLYSEDLTLTGVSIEDKAGPSVSSRDVTWRGDVLVKGDGLPQVDGDLALNKFRSIVNDTPLGSTSLVVESLKLNPQGEFLAKAITVDGLWVDQRKKKHRSHARMQRLELNDLVWKEDAKGSSNTGHLAIRAVTMLAPELRLVRSKAKQWDIPAVKKSVKKTPKVAPTSLTDTQVPGQSWSIGELRIRKGRVQVQDYSLSSENQPTLADLNIVLKSLDSRRRESDSSLRIAARVGEYGKISLKGKVRPLADKVSVDLVGKVAGLGLTDFNVYVADALGQRIESGQMDADVTLKIVKNELDVQSKLVIHKLEMGALPKTSKVREPKSTDTQKQGGQLPIGLALTLLRDSNNQISLELPLKGRLDDPKFDPGDAISQAVGSAMTTGVALFIQPLGSLLIAGKMIAGAASSIRFEPAVFVAGSRELDSKQRAYLSELAEKLKARPQMHMKVCGRATQADRGFFQPVKKASDKSGDEKSAAKLAADVGPQLRALAKQRGRVVRAYLVKQAGVDHRQLVACSVLVEADDALPPRVELGL